jgi:uncharacterized protein (DUF1499 family)
MAPILFSGPPEAAADRIRAIIATFPRATIDRDSGNYMHVEFRSALFRFVDDVEFLIDPNAGQIHFRSASRVGHGDLGANRRRMEAIGAAWNRGG